MNVYHCLYWSSLEHRVSSIKTRINPFSMMIMTWSKRKGVKSNQLSFIVQQEDKLDMQLLIAIKCQTKISYFAWLGNSLFTTFRHRVQQTIWRHHTNINLLNCWFKLLWKLFMVFDPRQESYQEHCSLVIILLLHASLESTWKNCWAACYFDGSCSNQVDN